MKKVKVKHAKLLKVKGSKRELPSGVLFGKTETKKKKKKVPLKTFETKTKEKKMSFDFDNIEVGRAPPQKRSKPPTRFSPPEDAVVIAACKKKSEEGMCDIDFLNQLARHLNVKFHQKKKQRTGESLWWHIKREQQKGNTYFAGISIPQGSPGMSSKKKEDVLTNGTPTKRSQVINSALKQSKSASTAPATTKSSGGKGVTLDLIVRNPDTGESERIKTNKFSSVEDLMFALT
jgi:hypothetical protein